MSVLVSLCSSVLEQDPEAWPTPDLSPWPLTPLVKSIHESLHQIDMWRNTCLIIVCLTWFYDVWGVLKSCYSMPGLITGKQCGSLFWVCTAAHRIWHKTMTLRLKSRFSALIWDLFTSIFGEQCRTLSQVSGQWSYTYRQEQWKWLDWLGQSPDLNPTDHDVFHLLKTEGKKASQTGKTWRWLNYRPGWASPGKEDTTGSAYWCNWVGDMETIIAIILICPINFSPLHWATMYK